MRTDSESQGGDVGAVAWGTGRLILFPFENYSPRVTGRTRALGAFHTVVSLGV